MARASGTDLAKRSRLGTTHDQGVALAHSGEGLIEAGPGAGGAGEAVVGVDAILGDAEVQEGLALGVQILAVGGTAGVSDEGCGHGGSVRIGSHNRNCYRTHSYETLLGSGWAGVVGDGLRPSPGRSPYGQPRACRDEASGARGLVRLVKRGPALPQAGLNLFAAIVIYRDTAHLDEAVRQQKHAGLTVGPEFLARILLTGEYR